MDRLTRDVLAAQKRGLSYGKYMGLKYEAEQKAREAAEPRAVRRGKRGHCAVCGMLIPPASKSSKYCCQECARNVPGRHRKKLKLTRGRRSVAEFVVTSWRTNAASTAARNVLILPAGNRWLPARYGHGRVGGRLRAVDDRPAEKRMWFCILPSGMPAGKIENHTLYIRTCTRAFVGLVRA